MSIQPSTLKSLSGARNDQPSVHLHIERLVLEGLPVTSSQGHLVQAAIESELSRLISEQGLNDAAAGATPYLRAGSIELTHESKPASVGHQIASAIHNSLTPTSVAPAATHGRGGAAR